MLGSRLLPLFASARDPPSTVGPTTGTLWLESTGGPIKPVFSVTIKVLGIGPIDPAKLLEKTEVENAAFVPAPVAELVPPPAPASAKPVENKLSESAEVWLTPLFKTFSQSRASIVNNQSNVAF